MHIHVPLWKILLPTYMGNIWHYWFISRYGHPSKEWYERVLLLASETLPWRRVFRFVKRCRIRESILSIPANHPQIHDVTLLKIERGKWQNTHCRMLCTLLNSTPFFFAMREDLAFIIKNPCEELIWFVLTIENYFLGVLREIGVKIERTIFFQLSHLRKTVEIKYLSNVNSQIPIRDDTTLLEVLAWEGPDAEKFLAGIEGSIFDGDSACG